MLLMCYIALLYHIPWASKSYIEQIGWPIVFSLKKPGDTYKLKFYWHGWWLLQLTTTLPEWKWEFTAVFRIYNSVLCVLIEKFHSSWGPFPGSIKLKHWKLSSLIHFKFYQRGESAMESPQGLWVVGPLATFPSCPCNAYAQKSYMVKASPSFVQLAAQFTKVCRGFWICVKR